MLQLEAKPAPRSVRRDATLLVATVVSVASAMIAIAVAQHDSVLRLLGKTSDLKSVTGDYQE